MKFKDLFGGDKEPKIKAKAETKTKPGFCPNHKISLVATCPTCGNPIVGEQIQLED